jgi:hypothetical protein
VDGIKESFAQLLDAGAMSCRRSMTLAADSSASVKDAEGNTIGLLQTG